MPLLPYEVKDVLLGFFISSIRESDFLPYFPIYNTKIPGEEGWIRTRLVLAQDGSKVPAS